MTNREAIKVLEDMRQESILIVETYEKAIEALKQTTWTPCSEGLPEDVEEGEEYPTVIYCAKDYNVSTGFYDYVTEKWWDIKGFPADVIAWMPLPESFMKGEEE